jgi:hypothetical protein
MKTFRPSVRADNPFRPLDWLRYALARLGWPGVAGLTLLAAAWLAQSLEVQSMRNANMAMQQRAERLAKQVLPAREIEATRQAALSATLPGAERMPEAVARLFAAAKHAGLTLQQGAYRAVGDKAGGEKSSGLSRYQISLPVTGDYPAVRAFVAEALEREPGLALDGMRLARERMDLGEIDAELRFTLYLGGAR